MEFNKIYLLPKICYSKFLFHFVLTKNLLINFAYQIYQIIITWFNFKKSLLFWKLFLLHPSVFKI